MQFNDYRALGFTTLQNGLIAYYPRLNISDAELLLIIQLEAFNQRGESFPSNEKIAANTNLSVTDVGNLIQETVEKASAAQMRRAFRDTFGGISEEELDFLVDIDKRETFGGAVSKEEEDKALKIRSKYLGIDKMRDDIERSLKEVKNDLQTLQ